LLPVALEFEITLPQGENLKYAAVQGDGIGRGLYWRGLTWLGGEFLVFYALARNSNLILDIGANTGIYTLIACAANSTARVIAFEPVAAVYDRLKSNIKINRFENRCEARNEAASDLVGTTNLFVPPGLIPDQATLDTSGAEDPGHHTVEISTTTVDSVCHNRNVDLVKIDVEGLEYRVLRGMQQVLIRCKPPIIIEHHSNCPSSALKGFLSEFGYRFSLIRKDGGLWPVQTFRPGVRDHFLCTVS